MQTTVPSLLLSTLVPRACRTTHHLSLTLSTRASSTLVSRSPTRTYTRTCFVSHSLSFGGSKEKKLPTKRPRTLPLEPPLFPFKPTVRLGEAPVQPVDRSVRFRIWREGRGARSSARRACKCASHRVEDGRVRKDGVGAAARGRARARTGPVRRAWATDGCEKWREREANGADGTHGAIHAASWREDGPGRSGSACQRHVRSHEVREADA